MTLDMTAFRSLRSTPCRVAPDSRAPHGLRTVRRGVGGAVGELLQRTLQPSKVASENQAVAEQFVQAALESHGPALADMAYDKLQQELAAGRNVTAKFLKGLIRELDRFRRQEIDRQSQATATLFTWVDAEDSETPFAFAFGEAVQATGMNVSLHEVDISELLDRIEWAIMGAGRGRELIDQEQGMRIAVREIKHFLLAKRDALDVAMVMSTVKPEDRPGLRRFLLRRPEVLRPVTLEALWERAQGAMAAVGELLQVQDPTELAGVLRSSVGKVQADLESDKRWAMERGGEMASEETASMILALGIALAHPDAAELEKLHRLCAGETVNQMRGALRLLSLNRRREAAAGARTARRMYMALNCLIEETGSRDPETEQKLHRFVQNVPEFESTDDVPVEPRRALARGAGMPLSV